MENEYYERIKQSSIEQRVQGSA